MPNIRVLATAGFAFFLTQSLLATLLFGQAKPEVEKTTQAKVLEKTEQAASSLLGTVKEAVNGDSSAISELTNRFLIPSIIALSVMMIGYFIASFIGRVIGGAVTKKVDLTLGKFLTKFIKNAIMAMLMLGVLGYFGVDVTGFAVILAALGFAGGMALQGTLSNFAAGIMLLVFRPFKVGDYIQVGGEEGTVDEIDLFTTRMNTLDNVHKIIPNGQIFGTTITNFTHNEVRRVQVNVGSDYNADVDRTRAVLQAAISEIPGAAENPPPQVVMTSLGDSCVKWQVRAWCEPDQYWSVHELLTVASKKGMDLNGIRIPFPQLELHLPHAEQPSIRKAA